MTAAYRPKGQAEIEEELENLAAHLEALTNGGYSPITGEALIGYDEILALAADAEVDYKVEFARRIVEEATDPPPRDRKDLQEARATLACQDLLRTRRRADAVAASRKEALYTTRARLDAKRTQAANVRAQT